MPASGSPGDLYYEPEREPVKKQSVRTQSDNERTSTMKVLRAGFLISMMVVMIRPAASKGAESSSFFPKTNEVPGWAKSGETRTFNPDNLYEYVDGDDQRYIQAGVQKTLTSYYKYRDKFEAVVDIYVMNASAGSRRIFDSESSAGTELARLGDAAQLSRNTLAFRKGIYFVRIVAYEGSPEVSKAILALGKAVDGKLGSGKR